MLLEREDCRRLLEEWLEAVFVTEVLAEGSQSVPATVRDAVLARVAKLSARALAVAELVCIVPGTCEGWLLTAACATEPAAAEECVSAGMVYGVDGSLAFRHELARRAVEDSLTPVQRC